MNLPPFVKPARQACGTPLFPPGLRKICLLALVPIIAAGMAKGQTTYSFSAATSNNWGTSGNWSPNGVPGAADTVDLQSNTGSFVRINASDRSVGNFFYNFSSGTFGVYGDSTSDSLSLTIGGTLTKQGSGVLEFRNSTGTLSVSANVISLQQGLLAFGDVNGTNTLSSLSVTGLTTISGTGSILGFNTGAATLAGVSFTGSGGEMVLNETSLSNVATTVTVASLSSVDSSAIVAAVSKGVSGSGLTAVLGINGSSGTSTFLGQLEDNMSTGSGYQLSVVKSGGSYQILSGNNTYSGSTSINGGTLEASAASSLSGYNTAGKITVNSGGTLAVSANSSGGWTAANIGTLLSNTTFNAGSALGIDTAANTGTFAYSSTVSGALGLTKLGANTLALSGSESYSGATTVTAGTLLLSSGASINGSSGLSVASDAILSTSGAAINLNANFSGSTTLSINSPASYGQVNVGGQLTYGGNLTLQLLAVTSGTYDLFTFSSTAAGSDFSSITIAGAVSGTLTETLAGSGNWSGTAAGDSYAFSTSNGELVVTPVPEPGQSAMIIGGLTLLGIFKGTGLNALRKGTP